MDLKRWSTDNLSTSAADVANGADTRFLLSWGPLGIFDYEDPAGRHYRLNPGEEFTFAFAILLGRDFHDANHPQPSNTTIDSSLFRFAGLEQTARRAKFLYDHDYVYLGPLPADNFRPSGRSSGAVPLAWSPPELGVTRGYNIYRLGPDSSRVQCNTSLVTDSTFNVTGLSNAADYRFELETVGDSGWVSERVDTLVRVGVPLPLTNLTATTTGAIVHLQWTPGADPGITSQKVARRDRLGDSTTFDVASSAFATDDDAALPGHHYTYWVMALNSVGNSLPSRPATALPWAPQHRILVIDETDSATATDITIGGGIPADSVDSMYSELLTGLGEQFDRIEQPFGMAPVYSFESLAQYDLVIWHSEDNKTWLNNQQLEAREQLLSDYVRAEGRLLRFSRNFLAGDLNLPGLLHGNPPRGMLSPLTFDSLYGLGHYPSASGRAEIHQGPVRTGGISEFHAGYDQGPFVALAQSAHCFLAGSGPLVAERIYARALPLDCAGFRHLRAGRSAGRSGRPGRDRTVVSALFSEA